MALIKYGALAQELSGSVGGATFARVHDAKIVRGWRAPANKRTHGQQTLRSLLAQFAANWKNNESQTNRDGWDVYAPSCIFVNPLGGNYTISGFNMYTRNLTALTYFSIPLTVEYPYPRYPAPLISGFPQTYTLEITFTHATGVLALTHTDPPAPFTDWLTFSVHNYMPASRKFPVRQALTRKALLPYSGLPQTIHTYSPLPPGATGSVRAVLFARTADLSNAISTPQSITILSF